MIVAVHLPVNASPQGGAPGGGPAAVPRSSQVYRSCHRPTERTNDLGAGYLHLCWWVRRRPPGAQVAQAPQPVGSGRDSAGGRQVAARARQGEGRVYRRRGRAAGALACRLAAVSTTDGSPTAQDQRGWRPSGRRGRPEQEIEGRDAAWSVRSRQSRPPDSDLGSDRCGGAGRRAVRWRSGAPETVLVPKTPAPSTRPPSATT